jgi:hypothetical protein
MMCFSFSRGDYRGQDIDHSGAPELQVNGNLALGEGLAMWAPRAARPAQLLPENAV